MATFNVQKAKAAGWDDAKIQDYLSRHPEHQPSEPVGQAAPPQQPPAAPQTNTDVVMGAAKQALNAMPMAAAANGDIAKVPSDVRRPLIKGALMTAGGGNPVAAGAASAAGGLISDAIDNPQQAMKAAGIAGQSVIDPVAASKKLMALKPEEIHGLVNQAKKAGADFGEGLLAGSITQALDGILATGPFKAGMKNPTSALPGAVKKAGEELQRAKDAAGAFKDYGGIPPQRFKAMSEMITNARGSVKLANLAKDSLQSGRDMGVSELLILRQAAGQAEELGGVLAPTYAATKSALDAQLAQKAPMVMEKIKHFADVAKATGLNENQALYPFFVSALNPKMGLVKAATLPWIRGKAGAVVGTGLRTLAPAAELANSATKRLTGQSAFEQALSAIKKRRNMR